MRPASEGNFGTPLLISIHAPTWGATRGPYSEVKKYVFQSTHPRGVRLPNKSGFDLSHEFQSTHPRGVRRKPTDALSPAGTISIHAPTWGATLISSQIDLNEQISIHAPTWGATVMEHACAESCRFQSTHPRGVRHGKAATGYVDVKFQSTHPRGVRRARLAAQCLLQGISIHAPTWGATYNTRLKDSGLIFQSTHPRGVRQSVRYFFRFTFLNFNPRTHVGCDRLCNFSINRFINFNPRTHVGCDVTIIDFLIRPGISIHAPTWGATQTLNPTCSIKSFQSTHPRGVRRYCTLSLFCYRYFNPRTHVGCDSPKFLQQMDANISIHAPTWGATFH